MKNLSALICPETKVYDLGGVDFSFQGMKIFIDYDNIFLVNFETNYYLEIDDFLFKKINEEKNIIVDGVIWTELLRETIKGIFEENYDFILSRDFQST